MKKIAKHIVYLLTRYDCVIVPDLGGFIVREERAIILPNKILPPRKVVSFNAQLTHNDGLLASKYAQKHGIKYNQALEEIRFFVDNLFTTINSGKTIEIENIGVLYRNMASKIEFIPREAGFIPDNFGLSTLHIAPRVQKKAQITITIPQRSNIFRYAAACMLGIMFWLMSPTVEDSSLSNYSGINPINWVDILAKKERQEAEEKAQKLDSIQKLLIAEKHAQTMLQLKYKYHIIVAALDANTAQKYCNELIANNHHSARIIQHKGLYRVAIKSFNTKKEAIRQMQKLRRTNIEHNQAWVFCE